MAATTDAPVDAAPDPPAGSDRRVDARRIAATVALPLLLVLVAGVLRFHGISDPPRIYFDETYYTDDAHDLLRYGVERTFNVHPPVGKWLIAGSIGVFGFNPLGWRAAPALAGTLTVLFVYLAGLRLFRRRGIAALAALLLALDGLAFTMSRIAMLDAFLGLFVTAGFWLLLVDRDRQWAGAPPAGAEPPADPVLPPRPRLHRWLAGLAFGLALATKWSALLAIGAAGLVLLVSEAMWRRRWTGRWWHDPAGAVASIALPLLLVPAAVYVLSYAGWFANLEDSRLGDRLCPEGACALSVPDMAREWWGEQQAINRFHQNLQAEHPYRSTADRWPALHRPVAYYYESCDAERADQGACHVEMGNVAEIIGMGNPAIWWLALPAYLLLAWWAARELDWTAAVVLAFALGQYVPWLVTSRPLFFFYMTPVVPFMCLALAHATARLARRPDLAWLPAFVAVLAAAAFVFWYPLLAGTEISQEAWELRIWMRSWI
jgi:dolichyl-phosphate-mannose-protein mannosyltransferase